MLHSAPALARGLLVFLFLATCIPPGSTATGTTQPRQQQHIQLLSESQYRAQSHAPEQNGGRHLHGRFLHITDIHPDPFYKTYSSTESSAACHRKRGPAGLYGAETSGCDTPYSLVNETFAWIKENLKGKIDFVVWTGDSARHDNDEEIPRTSAQVVEQNEFVLRKIVDVFGDDEDGRAGLEIPVVPTFGNNDVMPHNIFLSGPNKWSKRYLDIWRGLIPEAQRHSFQQGGWFYVEVIPNKLAVLSMNTLYFFSSNSAVDGCANRHEPGYEHLNWLRIQLQLLRDRNMKAILIGHVPPARTKGKQSWDETCWQKYALWMRQYRDVVITGLYGHMNVDHFVLQDFKDVKKGTKSGEMRIEAMMENGDTQTSSMWEDGEVSVESASDYLVDLRKKWSKLPTAPKSISKRWNTEDNDDSEGSSVWQWLMTKLSPNSKNDKGGKGKPDKKQRKKKFLKKIGGRYAERFSVSQVAPSIVPNYFPTLRVYEYNITGMEDLVIPPDYDSSVFDSGSRSQTPMSSAEIPEENDAEWAQRVSHTIDTTQKKKTNKKAKKKPRKHKFVIPSPPSKAAPPGPAYSPQPLTLLGYVQYYANLTYINNDFVEPSAPESRPDWEIARDVESKSGNDTLFEAQRWKEGKHRNHQGKKPRPKPHPRPFEYEVEYNTRDDKIFGLKDLTVRRYLQLAARIGKGGGKKKGKGKSMVLDEDLDSAVDEGEDDWDFDDLDSDSDSDSDEEDEADLDAFETDSDEEVESDESWVIVNADDRDAAMDAEARKKHKRPKHRRNNAWYTFVKRAFVSTMDPREIEREFGTFDGEVVETGSKV